MTWHCRKSLFWMAPQISQVSWEGWWITPPFPVQRDGNTHQSPSSCRWCHFTPGREMMMTIFSLPCWVHDALICSIIPHPESFEQVPINKNHYSFSAANSMLCFWRFTLGTTNQGALKGILCGHIPRLHLLNNTICSIIFHLWKMRSNTNSFVYCFIPPLIGKQFWMDLYLL